MTGNSPLTITSPPCARASLRTSSAARSAMARRSIGDSISCCGLREVQEIRHHLAERFGLLADALDMRVIRRRQRVQIEQPRVTVNRRQAVAELVRDARRQLADLREALLQPKLLLHFDDRRQIGEQANGAVRLALAVRQRRDADAEIGRRLDRPSSTCSVRRTIGVPTSQTFLNDAARALRAARRDSSAPTAAVVAAAAAAGRPDSECEAVRRCATTSRPDDRLSTISPLSRSDASARADISRSCAFSLVSASCRAAVTNAVSVWFSRRCRLDIARRRRKPQHGEHQDADQRRHDRRETDDGGNGLAGSYE